MSNQKRIEEIKEILNKDFVGLDIGKFAYCKYSNDYIRASYFNNAIEACIEVTRTKPEFQKEHRQLNIFHSYILEIIDLGSIEAL